LGLCPDQTRVSFIRGMRPPIPVGVQSEPGCSSPSYTHTYILLLLASDPGEVSEDATVVDSPGAMYGVFGRLGHGDHQRQPLPKKIEALAGRRVVAVSTGCDHSLALTPDGAVFTWGKGDHSCLGHGEDLSNQLLPKKIEAWGAGQ